MVEVIAPDYRTKRLRGAFRIDQQLIDRFFALCHRYIVEPEPAESDNVREDRVEIRRRDDHIIRAKPEQVSQVNILFRDFDTIELSCRAAGGEDKIAVTFGKRPGAASIWIAGRKGDQLSQELETIINGNRLWYSFIYGVVANGFITAFLLSMSFIFALVPLVAGFKGPIKPSLVLFTYLSISLSATFMFYLFPLRSLCPVLRFEFGVERDRLASLDDAKKLTRNILLGAVPLLGAIVAVLKSLHLLN